ncbi:MAG: DUF922 domain-containing Zn-dependent protease [Vicinamibacterales bacterium]|nr:DUF922 domain-containing Zn-dependent protease [Vicinamibacterales bacterium]
MHRHSAIRSLPSALSVFAILHAAGPIEWAESVKLTQADFRGKAPDSSADTAHSWVALDVTWECLEGRPRSHARAVFDPDQSWWRGGTPSLWGGIEDGLSRTQLDNRRTATERDRDLLRHEQLHFDLTEVAARRIRRQFDGLTRACATPGGNLEIEKGVAAIEAAWADEQRRYDKDTDHGVNQVTQRQWESRVRRELQ